MRFQERITNWRDAKGFGFITPNGGGGRVFCHIKGFSRFSRRPVLNDRVNYTLQKDDKGRTRAENVELVGNRRPRASGSGRNPTLIVVASGFLGLVAVLAAQDRLPLVIGAIYAIMSTGEFAIYAIDKAAARTDRRRIEERTLILLGLLGGWPGGLIAQQVLRHKSNKRSFLIPFWISVVTNVSGLLWLMSSSGQALISGIAG